MDEAQGTVSYWFRSSSFTRDQVSLVEGERIRYVTENLYVAQTGPAVLERISGLDDVLLEIRKQ